MYIYIYIYILYYIDYTKYIAIQQFLIFSVAMSSGK